MFFFLLLSFWPNLPDLFWSRAFSATEALEHSLQEVGFEDLADGEGRCRMADYLVSSSLLASALLLSARTFCLNKIS